MSLDDDLGRAPDAPQRTTGKRPHSTIKFPYVSLDEVTSIAETMLNQYPSGCSMIQLASALGQMPSSGAFRVKVTAAKMYGAITGRGDALTLTSVGAALADPRRTRRARVDAFLAIPLYKKMYELASEHGGMMAASPDALERTIVELGVVAGQAETARLAFQRSAKFAGFYEHGANRLIMPAHLEDEADEPGGPEPEAEPVEVAQDPVALPGKPSILIEVFKRLPDEGEPFDKDERKAWNTLLTAALDVLYPGSAAGAAETVKVDR